MKTIELKPGWPILLLLHFKREIVTHIRLQKMLFLAFSEGKLPIYNFRRADYGPYDRDIKLDAITLADEDYIDLTKYVQSTGALRYRVFRITEKGDGYIEELIKSKKLPEKYVFKMKAIVEKYGKDSWETIVSVVYSNFDVLDKKIFDKERYRLAEKFKQIRDIWVKRFEKKKCALLCFIFWRQLIMPF